MQVTRETAESRRERDRHDPGREKDVFRGFGGLTSHSRVAARRVAPPLPARSAGECRAGSCFCMQPNFLPAYPN